MWLIIRGIVRLISAFGPVTNGSRWRIGISGVLFIIAGIVFIANPGGAALGFAVMLGVLALAWGVFHLIGGILIRRKSRQQALKISALYPLLSQSRASQDFLARPSCCL